jgi:hypothetical protein
VRYRWFCLSTTHLPPRNYLLLLLYLLSQPLPTSQSLFAYHFFTTTNPIQSNPIQSNPIQPNPTWLHLCLVAGNAEWMPTAHRIMSTTLTKPRTGLCHNHQPTHRQSQVPTQPAKRFWSTTNLHAHKCHLKSRLRDRHWLRLARTLHPATTSKIHATRASRNPTTLQRTNGA